MASIDMNPQRNQLVSMIANHADAYLKRSYVIDSHFDKNECLIWLDALNTKDVPMGIDLNSIYIKFNVDEASKTVSVAQYGHLPISEEDKKRYPYYACLSMKNVYIDMGGKNFRKQKYKNYQELVRKVFTYFDNVMAAVDKYTGGYPYKK